MYGFSVRKEHITAFGLNTNPDTPYTYYDLIDEGSYCESDGKVVEFPYISADKCGVINIKGLPVGTYKFTEVINDTQQ